jgi:hypothetical protein
MAVAFQTVKHSRVERECCACGKKISVGSYYHFWEFGDKPQSKCRACGPPKLSEREPHENKRSAYQAFEILQDGVLMAGDMFILRAAVEGCLDSLPKMGSVQNWSKALRNLTWSDGNLRIVRAQVIKILGEFPV